MKKILDIENAEFGKWVDSQEYEPIEMLPILCAGSLRQPCSGTSEYETFVAQFDPDEGHMVELNTGKEVFVAYWMYIPEVPELEGY